jgi:hypothetical protein
MALRAVNARASGDLRRTRVPRLAAPFTAGIAGGASLAEQGPRGISAISASFVV